jgi:hypothetical protein
VLNPNILLGYEKYIPPVYFYLKRFDQAQSTVFSAGFVADGTWL